MIKLPVRCEQDTANSLVIRDTTNREVCNFISDGSHVPHVLWEDAKQIVRALNAGLAKQDKDKKKSKWVNEDQTLEAARRHGSKF